MQTQGVCEYIILLKLPALTKMILLISVVDVWDCFVKRRGGREAKCASDALAS